MPTIPALPTAPSADPAGLLVIDISGATYHITLHDAVTPFAGSVSIGGPVTGGTAGALLYVDAGPVLAQDPTHLSYDPVHQVVHLLSSPGTDALILQASGPPVGSFTSPTFGLARADGVVFFRMYLDSSLTTVCASAAGPVAFPSGLSFPQWAEFGMSIIPRGNGTLLIQDDGSGLPGPVETVRVLSVSPLRCNIALTPASSQSVPLFATVDAGHTIEDSVPPYYRFTLDSSGTLSFLQQDSTTPGQLKADIQTGWIDPTHATRKGYIQIGAYDAASAPGSPRIGVIVSSNGTEAITQLAKIQSRAFSPSATYDLGDGGSLLLDGTDNAGNVGITTGAGGTGTLFSVTFSGPFPNNIAVVLTASTASAAGVAVAVVWRSASGFSVITTDTLAASQAYDWCYLVIGY